MAEYIEREAVLKVLNNSLNFSENELLIGDFRRGCIAAIKDDIGNVKHIPIADVVEVVRCKECKHWDGTFCNHGTMGIIDPFETDFCSYGERKDNGT